VIPERKEMSKDIRMWKSEKKRFVHLACRSMAQDICKHIDEGRVPDEWDGHELRCLIAHRAEQWAAPTKIMRNPKCERAKEFHNTITITTL
jgi:hypothetical protein